MKPVRSICEQCVAVRMKKPGPACIRETVLARMRTGACAFLVFGKRSLGLTTAFGRLSNDVPPGCPFSAEQAVMQEKL